MNIKEFTLMITENIHLSSTQKLMLIYTTLSHRPLTYKDYCKTFHLEERQVRNNVKLLYENSYLVEVTMNNQKAFKHHECKIINDLNKYTNNKVNQNLSKIDFDLMGV